MEIDKRDVEFKDNQIARMPIKEVFCNWCIKKWDIRDCRKFNNEEVTQYMCPQCQDELLTD